jgi:hypothetical protein
MTRLSIMLRLSIIRCELLELAEDVADQHPFLAVLAQRAATLLQLARG